MLLPGGRCNTREWLALGSAYTTSTRIVPSGPSVADTRGFAHEIVDHAVGQMLESERQRRAHELAGDLELHRQADLDPDVAERTELPHAGERAERPVDEAHLDA